MRRKIAEVYMKDGSRFEVILDKTVENNEFRVYHIWNDGKMHKKQMVRYANQYSAIWYIAQIVAQFDWEV